MPVTAFQEMSVTGKVTGRDVENARNDLQRREMQDQLKPLI
ncbi:MAG: hypothetical protein RBR52_11715 [Thiomonas sp.]|nr:hypothetical protein [Thiomonas sp.]MDY0331145.1 hypothetical protein [Thiomonas sp.]